MSPLDQRSEYRVRLAGRLEEDLAGWLGPVRVTVSDAEPRETTVSGIITDQAGIVGLVRRLHGLGIEILSLERIG